MSAATKRPPVLIANRGEIAIRIARTCHALGFPVVGVYSDVDRFSEHLRYCDSAFCVGSAAPQESYLHIERIIDAAKKSGARYIHPGYGFLSERPLFAKACKEAGITFVGPSEESMRLMGDKIRARATVDLLKLPRVPGSGGAVPTHEEAAKVAEKIGYPILLKATAGGGGKGMRRVDSHEELPAAFGGATREAQGAFGDGSLYVEKLILKPHHVEIQVFGDGKGKAIHLGERECSIQRRHQKIWEESPSPILNRYPATREAMYETAVRITQHVKYAGAGTLEFIVDEEGNFYFLEMNTRLQVEHPVTEWVTGVDLVAWQLLLAAEEFQMPAQPPERRGSAIEVRVYAEDPQTFLPAPGRIGLIQMPSGAFVRSDAAFSEPGEVSVHYDPMIAKISVWAPTRAEALNRLRVALDEARVDPPKRADGTVIGSLKTNLSLLKRLVRNDDVIAGRTSTDLIPNHPDLVAHSKAELSMEAALAIALTQFLQDSRSQYAGKEESGSLENGHASPVSLWGQMAKQEGIRS